MTEAEARDRYCYINIQKFLDLILVRDENSDIAAFYLLRWNLRVKLEDEYNLCQLKDELCDVLSDFYLYLRDGNNGSYDRPYQGLENIQSPNAFESYILQTFRYYLLNRLKQEQQQECALKNSLSDNDYDNIRDFHIHCLGVLIAVIDTTFEPLKLFIFYRSLISKLRGCAMSPSNEMAGALGISYDNYRKIDSRNKEAALSLLNEIEHGLSTNLDESQSLLALRVENDYEQLLEIIKELYEKALDQLECKEAVWDLRRRPHTKTHRIEYSMGIPDEYDENGNKIYHGPEIEIDFSDMSIKQQRWVTLIGFLNDK